MYKYHFLFLTFIWYLIYMITYIIFILIYFDWYNILINIYITYFVFIIFVTFYICFINFIIINICIFSFNIMINLILIMFIFFSLLPSFTFRVINIDFITFKSICEFELIERIKIVMFIKIVYIEIIVGDSLSIFRQIIGAIQCFSFKYLFLVRIHNQLTIN
jgi:hypothetical protein